jgi:hypothetical protein
MQAVVLCMSWACQPGSIGRYCAYSFALDEQYNFISHLSAPGAAGRTLMFRPARKWGMYMPELCFIVGELSAAATLLAYTVHLLAVDDLNSQANLIVRVQGGLTGLGHELPFHAAWTSVGMRQGDSISPVNRRIASSKLVSALLGSSKGALHAAKMLMYA